jgi:hypothetical protein
MVAPFKWTPGKMAGFVFGCGCLIFFGVFAGIAAVGTYALNSGAEFGGNSGTNPSGTGSLATVNGIPESLKPVFESAGIKFQVSPAFVAAIFYKEHGGGYQESGPWASSASGANGRSSL